MSLFVLADLHLSSDGSKAMDVFGSRWTDYMNKIRKNWCATVSPDDTVIVPGDISWSLKLEDALDDLRFLDALPGKKLIGKGNHDFWWSTAAKMKQFMEKNGITTIDLLYNNAYALDNCIVCGTRGWFVEENQQHTVGTVDYARIVNREIIRLKMSLDTAVALKKESGKDLEILVFFHFPPVWNGFVCREILDVLHEYGIRQCYFGHIHGAYYATKSFDFEGIHMSICSADMIDFTPMPISVSDF